MRFFSCFCLFIFEFFSNFATMTLVLVAILLIGFVLISTERLTDVNKAAIAVFAGTVGWVLYISFGTDFVTSQHGSEYALFLDGMHHSSDTVKNYIWQSIFLPTVGRCSEVILFLLVTMTIVEILHNNGCFDFLTVWLRTRNSRVMLWKLALCSFLLSANLDNITSTVMMLVIMNGILPRSRDRIIYGSVVVLAVNFGGVLTVIGDPITLYLWNNGAITASAYSMALIVPCIIGWALPTYLISRGLNERVQIDRPTMPYRGDDTNLKVWQRLLLFVVGIGGLWFIPTFHYLTKLSPFLGAFCVLSVLWVVNEIFNRDIMGSNRRMTRSIPQQLQYSIIQLILYVMGIMLAVSVVRETGAFHWFTEQINIYVKDVWILGIVSAVISMVLDNFATSLTMCSLYDMGAVAREGASPFVQDGLYWRMITYCTTVGSSILAFASVAGVVYLQTQRVSVTWYFRHVGIKVLYAGIIGLAIIWLTSYVW